MSKNSLPSRGGTDVLVAVGTVVSMAVIVGFSVAVAVEAAGVDPQAVSALMIKTENRKQAIFFMTFLLVRTSYIRFLYENAPYLLNWGLLSLVQ